MNLPPPPGLHQAYRHVCMMEGPDPELRLSTLGYDTLLQESKRQADELQRLKFLLRKHNIEPDTSLPVTIKYVSKNAIHKEFDGLTPFLPTEILLRILGYALTSPVPVIDPFYRMRIQNVTRPEQFSRQHINVECLSVSRVFNTEGTRLLLENNRFIFTQAAALENFAKISPELRATVKDVRLRVVGRYYGDVARTADFSGNAGAYHHTIPALQATVLARPDGMVNDQGIQAYCWLQVADFLKALQFPRELMSKNRPKLLPGLGTMRLDLVNFCDHLPVGISSFAAVVRWHLGLILDELVVTGLPGPEDGSDELMVLRNLLRDDGLFSSACPAFVSIPDGVKTLPVYGYNHHVLNSKKIGERASKKAPIRRHPEGGEPPKSAHADGTTIWKWTKDYDYEPKKWIEFDRASGRPMTEIEDEDAENDGDADGDQFDLGPLVLPALLNGIFPPQMFAPPDESADEEEEDGDADSEGMPDLIDLD
ncbi:hypothetical protein WAI453_009443 [Rhynchosporium graminicola]|uniref:Uncharacterized protein n=1 Tax=Rhynchosporium graminicola TaxID=2792576 RepID=A0A1E1KSG2_9HELO|nr:uncharacterized protein RCO7_02853 [Rhynchosporium commune]